MRAPSSQKCRLDLAHLWPTGSSWVSPSITARYFSSCPSDPTSRWTPCPPKYGKQWLQVRLGCIQLSPSCPFRRLHTFRFLRPARFYARFWIWRPSFERQKDFNLPEQRAAQRALFRCTTPRCRAYGSYSLSLSPIGLQLFSAGGNGVSRFSHMEFLCMPGLLRLRRVTTSSPISRVAFLPSGGNETIGPWIGNFEARSPCLHMHLSTLQVWPCGRTHMTRIQDGRLFLS